MNITSTLLGPLILLVLLATTIIAKPATPIVTGKRRKQSHQHQVRHNNRGHRNRYSDKYLLRQDEEYRDHPDVLGHIEVNRHLNKAQALEGKSFWEAQMQEELRSQLNKAPIMSKAKNIIFFLGDGTSITTMTAARLLKGQRTGKFEHEVMSWEKFPYSALIKTYSGNRQVTDSAASSTAYLSGVKGNQATLGVDTNVALGDCEAMNNPEFRTKSILRDFQDANCSTGIVTTTRVTHASPAGAYAHTADRHWENDDDINDDREDSEACDDIAEQLVLGPTGSNIKVVLGGGRRKFLPKGVKDREGGKGNRRDDGKNLIETWIAQKNTKGNASYVWNRDQLLNIDTSKTDYLMGLFDYSHMAFRVDEDDSNPSLKEMTKAALEVLTKDNNGYFLFVEGGNIDRAHHLNMPRSALEETLDFEAAIAVADQMTDADDTLIVVTADHSQPMIINGYPQRGSDILGLGDYSDIDGMAYTTLLYTNGPGHTEKDIYGMRSDPLDEDISDKHYMADSTIPMLESHHAGEDVILYARGPHAHLFTGIHENSYIPHALRYAACVGNDPYFCEKER